MGKKLTQEEVEQAYAEKGYELISEYKNARDILFVKDNKGFIYSSIWSNFNKETKPSKFHKSNPYTIQNIKLWINNNTKGYELLSTNYINATSDLKFKCPEGHEFKMSWNNFHRGQRCPICSNHQVTLENCIAITDPWMMKYFKNKEDAYVHSYGSHDIIKVQCPNCGKEKEMIINNIYNRKGIACMCNNTSYPEKIIISMLDQLNIKYTKEYKPLWSNNKRYDFYLENYNCIIECHGGQHYNENGFNTCGGRTLKEEERNDNLKKYLAEQNGFTYIELDCRKSELEWIKQSILNSELSGIIDLNNVDWLICEEFAIKNKIEEVCNYWKEHNEINNEGLTTEDIGKAFNLSRGIIIKFLNIGNNLKMCNYNGKEEMRKNGNKNSVHSKKPVEIFKDGESLGVFKSISELSKQSYVLFGVKLLSNSISQVCHNKMKQYKGYTFKYVKE